MNTDFLIIGGGVIGVNIALEVRKRHPQAKIVLIEKEPETGYHGSGRNSGVLHAGFYYTADSLKAKFTRDGNRELTAYCKANKLRLNACGKLVVAQDESEITGLHTLAERGKVNGVELDLISAAEARKIEPRVRTHEQALWSPATASVDPLEVLASFVNDARKAGIEIRTGVAYRSLASAAGAGANGGASVIRTSDGDIEAGFVINAAGLYADKIARQFGFSKDYTILPFKGVYLYCAEPPGAIKTNIYPVPNLANPFLGVHHTLTVEGKSKIGPTAIPAFWREQYVGFENFSLAELGEIMTREAGLFLTNSFNFRSLAWTEIKKYFRKVLVRQSAAMLDGVRAENYRHWGKPGIRAQLLHVKERKLVMDFCVEGDGRSLHVLNAVSPAFTCSIPFSRYVCDKYLPA